MDLKRYYNDKIDGTIIEVIEQYFCVGDGLNYVVYWDDENVEKEVTLEEFEEIVGEL